MKGGKTFAKVKTYLLKSVKNKHNSLCTQGPLKSQSYHTIHVINVYLQVPIEDILVGWVYVSRMLLLLVSCFGYWLKSLYNNTDAKLSI